MLNTYLVQVSTNTGTINKRISTNASPDRLGDYINRIYGHARMYIISLAADGGQPSTDAENHGGSTTEHQDAERWDSMS